MLEVGDLYAIYILLDGLEASPTSEGVCGQREATICISILVE